MNLNENMNPTEVTRRIMEPEEYQPFAAYELLARAYRCQCWLCGAGAARRSHGLAVRAGLAAGIRVQYATGVRDGAAYCGYGNRCPACYDK